ncbi:hypothetical protein Dda_3356 [Drechslerella dactyloides]|uniref:SH3 domain-containing protein n=1 Tax=Drechslerella dactyloides TaxID=74499 RepID=A0AAD6J3I0_DREDA|nr:hypothetical protein Dda_3356 [Drechslerella dactyloides]
MSAAHFPDPQLPSEESTSSFWLKQPDEFLLGHRTTAELPAEADIVIIGSGIAGAQTARYLCEQDGGAWIEGRRIVMLEAREACWGATGRNGGHCKPSLYAYPRLQHLFDDLGISETLTAINFELRNLSLLTSYIQENGVDCDFHKLPSCDAYFDNESFDLAVSSIGTLRRHAPELADKLTIVTDNATLEGLRVPTAVGAITIKDAAKLWPYKLVSHILKDLIKNRGLNLQTSTPVLAISTLNDGAPIPLHRIHTSRGALTAPIVIHATNAFASHLVPAMRDVIYPVRAQMSALEPPKSLVAKPLDYTYGLVEGERIKAEYLVQEDVRSDGTGGTFLLGGGRKYAKHQGVGVTDDNSVDAEVSGYLRSSVGKYFDDECGYPGKEKMCDAKYMWSGIMGFSADERPWVGKVPGTEGQYILAGFEGHGMAYTTGSAQALAQILHHRYPVLPDDPYSTYWNRNICVALYEFKATAAADNTSPLTQGQELSLEKDDVVDIIEKGHNGWWFGAVVRSKNQDRLNTFGWFPSNFVEEIPLPHGTDGVSMNRFEPSLYARLQEYPEEIFNWFPRSFTVSNERLKHAKEIAKSFDLEEMRSRKRGDTRRLVISKREAEAKEEKEAEARSNELYTQMLYDRYKLQFAVKLLECGKDEDNLLSTLESTALTNIEEKYLTADPDLIRKAKLVKPLKQLQRLTGTPTHQVDRQRISDILSKIDKDKDDDKKRHKTDQPPPATAKTKAKRKLQKGDKAKADSQEQTRQPQSKQTSSRSRNGDGIIVRDFAVEATRDQPVEKDLRASQILPHQHPLIAGLRTDEAVEAGDEWVVIVDERPE